MRATRFRSPSVFDAVCTASRAAPAAAAAFFANVLLSFDIHPFGQQQRDIWDANVRLTWDNDVPYTAAMDIDVLRQRLSDCRDRWGDIAASAGVSRKTLYRIADQPDYMPNLQTFLDLQRAIEDILSRPPSDEPEPDPRGPGPTKSGNGHSPGMEPISGSAEKATA